MEEEKEGSREGGRSLSAAPWAETEHPRWSSQTGRCCPATGDRGLGGGERGVAAMEGKITAPKKKMTLNHWIDFFFIIIFCNSDFAADLS